MRDLPTFNKSLEENHPERIRAFIRHIGNRLPAPTENEQWLRLRYWHYVNVFRGVEPYSSLLSNFHFDFIDDESFDAIAAKGDGVYLIGVQIGAIRNLQAFFTMALSHPQILPNIGNPSKEKAWLVSLEGCNWTEPLDSVLSHCAIAEPPPPNHPLDHARRMHAHRLAILAADFLFFHELGHLVHGHVEYVSSRKHHARIEEIRPTPNSGIGSLDMQALELQADSHAISIMVQDWFAFERDMPEGYSFDTPSEAIQSLVFAIATVFLMMDPTPKGIKHYQYVSHPHPAVRLKNALVVALNLAGVYGETALARVQQAWDGAIEDVGEVFIMLRMGAAVWYAAEHEFYEISTEYKRIVTHLSHILEAEGGE